MLIVEDEPLTGLLLARAVAERGVTACGPHARGSEALAALAERAPDAALLDVSLAGGTTSREVADALAEAGVPFAFVTGYGPETAAVAAAHPAALVIPKPVDPETVGMLLDELLARSGTGRAQGAA